jgi:hypothetical protein
MGLKITVKNAVEAMDLKAQVQQVCGLNTFTWKFTPAVNTWLGDDVITPATVEFDFKDQQWETYFQLRWSK